MSTFKKGLPTTKYNNLTDLVTHLKPQENNLVNQSCNPFLMQDYETFRKDVHSSLMRHRKSQYRKKDENVISKLKKSLDKQKAKVTKILESNPTNTQQYYTQYKLLNRKNDFQKFVRSSIERNLKANNLQPLNNQVSFDNLVTLNDELKGKSTSSTPWNQLPDIQDQKMHNMPRNKVTFCL